MFKAFQANIHSAVKKFQFGGPGGNGYGGYNNVFGAFWRTLSGSQYDYRREVGIPWENSAVMACCQWTIKAFPEASLCFQRKINNKWEVEDHPVIDLLSFPNDSYDASYLWAGQLMSWINAGNSYWYVDFNGFGLPKALYYMPHFQVTPQWPDSGTEFVRSYSYRVGGLTKILQPKHVIHFKNGVDLQNVRSGQSPLVAVLREICADNEASTAAAAIMRNLGIPGLTFVPDPNMPNELTQDQRQMIRTMGSEKMTGDRRGEMIVAPIPGKFDQFGFSPEQLAFDKIRQIPAERICAAIGLNPIVVGIGSDNFKSSYSNFKEAREAAYTSYLIPLWRVIGEQLTTALLPLYGEDPKDCRLHFDISNVQALQEDENERHERIRKDFDAGIITLAESRIEIGHIYKSDTDRAVDEIYKWQIPVISGRITNKTDNLL